MTEPYQNGYHQEDGYVKLYLPDGHLYKGRDEPVGGGEELWRYTGLPYGTLNWKPGDVGRPENGNGSDQKVLRVTDDELRSLGYPTGDVRYLLIIKGRPEDIPKFVHIYGMGISGKDHISDKLGFDIFGKSNEWFERQLQESGIHPVENLEYRPVRLGVLALQEYGLNSLRDIGTKKPINGKKLLVASEFPYLADLVLRKKVGVKSGSYEVIETKGQTESYAVSKDVDVILEVVESGNSLLANRLSAISFVLNSTPYFVVNNDTYGMFGDFVDELQTRLVRGKETLKEGEMGHLFRTRLSPDIVELDPHNFGDDTARGLLNRLFDSSAQRATQIMSTSPQGSAAAR